MRDYFRTTKISREQASLIFKIRTRMIDVKNNYRQSYTDLACPLDCKQLDTQEHLIMTCNKMSCNI